jgi:hypothetical protein
VISGSRVGRLRLADPGTPGNQAVGTVRSVDAKGRSGNMSGKAGMMDSCQQTMRDKR